MACTTCTTCGSSAPCACGSGSLSTCNQVGVTGCCGTSSADISSCCSNLVQATPLPYYSCAPACPEDHTQKIVINKFAADIKITSSWNIPVCGESATVTVPGLTAIAIGSYIWNSEFGYYEVIAFNSGTQQITVTNRCTEGNTAAGTNVPACTEFIITDPPVDISQQSGACVAIDFTAPPVCPAVGCCINITLTTVNGVVSGGVVQIGTGFYTVDAVLPNDVITICNNGDGILPGTSVIAQDASGNYQYCLTILSSNPCEAEAVGTVNMIGCSDGAIHPLTDAALGWIPTVSRDNTDEVSFRGFAFHDVCTSVTVAVPISAGTPDYNIAVTDSTIFEVGDAVTVAGQEGLFTISSFPDATHMIGDFDPVPSIANEIGTGSAICLSQDTYSAIETSYLGATPVVLTTTQTTTTAVVNESIVNSSAAKTMNIFYTIDCQTRGTVAGANTNPGLITTALNVNINGGGYNALATNIDPTYMGDDFPWAYAKKFSYSGTATVAAGGTWTLSASMTITNGGLGGFTITVSSLSFVKVNIIGVAC